MYHFLIVLLNQGAAVRKIYTFHIWGFLFPPGLGQLFKYFPQEYIFRLRQNGKDTHKQTSTPTNKKKLL